MHRKLTCWKEPGKWKNSFPNSHIFSVKLKTGVSDKECTDEVGMMSAWNRRWRQERERRLWLRLCRDPEELAGKRAQEQSWDRSWNGRASSGSVIKEPACSVGDLDPIPGSGRCPGEGNGNPLHYSCLENFKDRGDWWATIHGVTRSQTQLSDEHFLWGLGVHQSKVTRARGNYTWFQESNWGTNDLSKLSWTEGVKPRWAGPGQAKMATWR